MPVGDEICFRGAIGLLRGKCRLQLDRRPCRAIGVTIDSGLLDSGDGGAAFLPRKADDDQCESDLRAVCVSDHSPHSHQSSGDKSDRDDNTVGDLAIHFYVVRAEGGIVGIGDILWCTRRLHRRVNVPLR